MADERSPIDASDALPFHLRGNYAPVSDELTAFDLPIEGALPAGLDGLFLRNGPNQAFEPLGRYHVFEGDGMLHAIELEEGKAAYRNRWVNSLLHTSSRFHHLALYFLDNQSINNLYVA